MTDDEREKSGGSADGWERAERVGSDDGRLRDGGERGSGEEAGEGGGSGGGGPGGGGGGGGGLRPRHHRRRHRPACGDARFRARGWRRRRAATRTQFDERAVRRE